MVDIESLRKISYEESARIFNEDLDKYIGWIDDEMMYAASNGYCSIYLIPTCSVFNDSKYQYQLKFGRQILIITSGMFSRLKKHYKGLGFKMRKPGWPGSITISW